MGRSLIECFFMVYKTPSSCFPVISYCVKMRKVESINFRFGGRSTSFCSSEHNMSKQQGQHIVSPTKPKSFSQFRCQLKRPRIKLIKNFCTSDSASLQISRDTLVEMVFSYWCGGDPTLHILFEKLNEDMVPN